MRNLEVLQRGIPSASCMAVSATRTDRPVEMKGGMRIPLKPKTLQAVEALAHRGGWSVTKVIERPFGRDVLLTK